MKLGLALKPHLWSDERLALARQLGCDSIVAWVPLPAGDGVWHTEDLVRLKNQVNKHGMELAAIENPHPAHWDKILLGEDGRDEQLENFAQTIRNMGEAGIHCFGYNFSIVGVQGHWREANNRDGRGGAGVKSFDVAKIPNSEPPNNQNVWFNTTLEHRSPIGTIPPTTEEEVWERLKYFLKYILPVAEKAEVVLAAHPEDPPVKELRKMGRFLRNVENFEKLVTTFPSKYNCIEFCQGTFAEMYNADVISAIHKFGSMKKIAYVHFRNVSSRLPSFNEVFIDEGYVDMIEAIKAYKEVGFEGVIIPDHTPLVTSEAPWDTGMAFGLGYIRACLQMVDR